MVYRLGQVSIGCQKIAKALARSDLFRVDREWPFAVAIRAVADFHFLGSVLIERTQDGTTLSTVKLDVLELGKYTRPPGHDTRNANKVIQVACAEVA